MDGLCKIEIDLCGLALDIHPRAASDIHPRAASRRKFH